MPWILRNNYNIYANTHCTQTHTHISALIELTDCVHTCFLYSFLELIPAIIFPILLPNLVIIILNIPLKRSPQMDIIIAL